MRSQRVRNLSRFGQMDEAVRTVERAAFELPVSLKPLPLVELQNAVDGFGPQR